MSNRLEAIQAELFELQRERVAILKEQLSQAEAALESYSSFSSPGSSPSRKSGPKPTVNAPAKKKRAARKRGRADAGERLEQAVAVVREAGTAGISANKLAAKTGIPYAALRKLIAESGRFIQKGEKRASRLFLK